MQRLALLILSILFMSQLVRAQSSESLNCSGCSTKSESGTISQLKAVAKSATQSVCKSDGDSRNSSGTQEEVGTVEFGLFSAATKMDGLMAQAADKLKKLSNESSGCVSPCFRKNDPELVILSQPTKVKNEPSCPTSFDPIKMQKDEVKAVDTSLGSEGTYITKKISKAGDATTCQRAASDWAQEVLRGKNKIGSYLESQKCKAPCSYGSVIKLSDVEVASGQCEVLAKIQVQCGPPRADTEWRTKAIVVKNWSCELPQEKAK
jgi:hypothetical protein